MLFCFCKAVARLMTYCFWTKKDNAGIAININSRVVFPLKDNSGINVIVNFQSYLSLYYTFIKAGTPNNFNYSSIHPTYNVSFAKTL